MENKTLEDICNLLREKGFDESVLQAFRDEEMDGEAFCTALASCPGPDCLKDIVKKCGPRLRVYKALRAIYLESETSDVCPTPSASESGKGGENVIDSLSTSETLPSSSISGTILNTVSRKRKARAKVDLPSPFPIPSFRQTTARNLEKKVLLDSDRKYMVQTMATVLMTYAQRPSIENCNTVAKSLIEVYPFLKDSTGDGQHSWKWYLYNRCQNVNRPVCKEEVENGSGGSRKLLKLDTRNKHAYPCIPLFADDDASLGKHLDMLASEIAKPPSKQDPIILKELMKRTFSKRRNWVLRDLDEGEESVKQIIAKYPLLSKAAYVSQEFCQIVQKNVRDDFDQDLLSWSKAVIQYATKTQSNNTLIQTALDCTDDDPATCIKVSLKCLYLLFVSKKDKKEFRCESDDIPCLLKVVPRGTPPSESCDRSNNQPHIIEFCDPTDRGDDLAAQFFIAIEQSLMVESSNIFAAVYYLVAAHYVFNLAYNNKVNFVLLFLQEKVLGLPSTSVKRTPTTLTHLSGIERCKQDQGVEESPVMSDISEDN